MGEGVRREEREEMKKPKGECYSVAVTAYLTPKQFKKLEMMAKDNGTSLAHVIRSLIDETVVI